MARTDNLLRCAPARYNWRHCGIYWARVDLPSGRSGSDSACPPAAANWRIGPDEDLALPANSGRSSSPPAMTAPRPLLPLQPNQVNGCCCAQSNHCSVFVNERLLSSTRSGSTRPWRDIHCDHHQRPVVGHSGRWGSVVVEFQDCRFERLLSENARSPFRP